MRPDTQRLDHRLDELEAQLPPLPASALRMQRQLARRLCATYSELTEAWLGAGRRTAKATGEAAAGVADTARQEAERTAQRTATGVERVTEETERAAEDAAEAMVRIVDEAQARSEAVADTAADAVESTEAVAEALVDDTAEVAEPVAAGSYDDMTKAELYERATELDIAGRSKLSKAELIEALRNH